MHALVVEVEIDPSRADAAEKILHETVVPMIRQTDGFRNGTWARSQDRRRGRSLLIYETAEAAEAARQQVTQRMLPPDAPTRLVSAELFDVMAQA